MSKLFSGILILTLALLPSVSIPVAQAQGIEQLLITKVPVPKPRPQYNEIQVPQTTVSEVIGTIGAAQTVPAISGNLKDGLDALYNGKIEKALGIRSGMEAGSLDRKILAWAIALSGKPGVRSATIQSIARDLPSWPGQTIMRKHAERALRSENYSASAIIAAFGNTKPVSLEGAISLARAYLEAGQKQRANSVIAPFWRNEKLSKVLEKQVFSAAGSALRRKDHRVRMHKLLYNDRATAALRIAGRAEQTSLAKARAAVLRKSPKAGSLLKAVAASSKKDTGYLFAQIEHARRTENYAKAADLLLKAPSDSSLLIDPGEWWVEQRIVSRQMLEIGKYKKAYKIVSRHSAQEPSDIAEAEFHAGWYALRFLKDKVRARKHFANILKVSKRPISKARGHYWLGRANSAGKAKKHYREAAKHRGTFYGQLAAQELGIRKLKIVKTRPSASDRANLKNRETYKALKRLESIGYKRRAEIFYRHLARELVSPGELAILAADAERQNKYNLALQVGKISFQRGMDVDTLAWPIGAVPTSAKIGNTGRALAYSIARQESAFDKTAISGANARGLLQLLPGTAKGVAKRNGYKYSRRKLTSDAGYNATLGAAYLSEQLDRFGNSYVLTFAAYNAGPGRADEWLGRFGDPRGKPLYQVIDWIEQIPFTETRHYVQRVMENYQVYKHRIGGSGLTIRDDLVVGRR